MRDFDAVITRDGTVYHLAWCNHQQTVAHFGIRENRSQWAQNYWESDIRAPFGEGLGLQARGIEEPPGPVVRNAEKLTERLHNWHRGRDLRGIPENWGDVVEHVFEIIGARAPKYLNGRGGVYFRGVLAEVRDQCVPRLLGTARIELLSGTARVDQMWGKSSIDEMRDTSSIGEMRESTRVERMFDRTVVGMMCNSSLVAEMHDTARIQIMYGASRVLALFDASLCGRGCDGTVFTTDPTLRQERTLSLDERWKAVEVVDAGTSVFA